MSQTQDNLPSFNRRDEDRMALGHTPSTRSAELVAGARSYLLNTKETIALSKMAGRTVARILTDIDRQTNILWFFPARMMAIEALVKRHFPEDKPGLLLVDIAAGFSPRGLHMAKAFPQAQVIEVDLPEVVAEKQKRLKVGKIDIPPNLQWVEADLGKANLAEALNGCKANLITSEGLTLYLTREENTRLFKQVAAALAPGGVFMAEIYFGDKLQRLQQNSKVRTVASFIFRIVGNVPGLMPNIDVVKDMLMAEGFEQVAEHPVTTMMEELNQPKPLDVISIIVARQPAVEQAAAVAKEEEKPAVGAAPPIPETPHTPPPPAVHVPPPPPAPHHPPHAAGSHPPEITPPPAAAAPPDLPPVK